MTDFLHALKIAPDILGELRTRTTPEKIHTERTAPGTKPSTPLNMNTVDDADYVFALLVEHAEGVADVLGTKAPATAVWRVGGRPMGFPSDTTAETAYKAAQSVCRFLEHQTHMVPDDLRRDIENDITQAVMRLDNNYPSTAPPDHIQARCANCECLSMYRHPPRYMAGDESYVCDNCGKHHTEQEAVEQMVAREKELATKRKPA